jgi:hypothetical protein
MSATGTIQSAAVIAKTTQTQMGDVLGTEDVETLTLFLDYVKGDETGVDVIINARRTPTGADYPIKTWSDAAGVNTAVTQKIRLTATGNYAFTISYFSADYLRFTQGGSNNDGTPTGTLAAHYTMDS